MGWLILIMVILLQWNARSLLANGQEFKHFIKTLVVKPDIICIQETWLKPNLDFIMYGYSVIRKDRDLGKGGGCATFIKQGIPYRQLGMGDDQECIMVEIWERGEEIVIINYYNPCKNLELNNLLTIQGQNKNKVVWCADFNVHSTVWGGCHTDLNGRVIEELMEDRNLVCMNDGRGTRINIKTGKESAIDLTLVSNSLAGVSNWEIWKNDTVGSDHYPVVCSIGERGEIRLNGGNLKWIFGKADWDKFQKLNEEAIIKIDLSEDIDEMNNQITSTIIMAAENSIPRSSNRKERKLVPWWTEECQQAVKNRNKAFR